MTNHAHVRSARLTNSAWLMVHWVAGEGSSTGDSKRVNKTSSVGGGGGGARLAKGLVVEEGGNPKPP